MSQPDARSQVVRYLARALVAGEPTVEATVSRMAETLGRKWGWSRSLAVRYCARFDGVTRPRRGEVIAFLLDDVRFRVAFRRHRKQLKVVQRVADRARMLPVAAAAAWDVPAIESVTSLADWLRLDESELEWFADLKGLNAKPQAADSLRHYHYRIFAKRSGGMRLVEAPKERMKAVQRQILSGILDRIPAHKAVHGFVVARGITTFAAPHVGNAVVLRIDLKDFFPSIRRTRVQALFRTLGYPEAVADLLGGLTTTRTPRDILRVLSGESFVEMRELYCESHLPQGAPPSPALANACCYRLDCRLAGLAAAAGAAYTRYADDLAFSGDASFLRGVERFAAHASAIAIDEGFAVNFRKTRVMRQSVRQHLAGLVVNERVNLKRAEFDRLKAILTNCLLTGPEAQNREHHPAFREHLAGRVAFVASIHAARGERLRALLERVAWN